MPTLPSASLDQLFLSARTHRAWLDQPVDEAELRRLYELTRLGPTSANTSPARFVFVKSLAAKERLRPTLSAGNVERTMKVSVTVIVAVDTTFHEKMATLFPGRPEMQTMMASMPPEQREFFLVQNGSLEAGYLMLAARALGLDCGPMGGFDRAAVDEAFFAGTPWKSILLINLGHGDPTKVGARAPRLDFEEACRIE